MNNKNIYNTWYWQKLAIPAAKRIIAYWKNENRDISFSFEETHDQKDFREVITFLDKWKNERSNIDDSIRQDIFLVSNFEGYPAVTC